MNSPLVLVDVEGTRYDCVRLRVIVEWDLSPNTIRRDETLECRTTLGSFQDRDTVIAWLHPFCMHLVYVRTTEMADAPYVVWRRLYVRKATAQDTKTETVSTRNRKVSV